MNVNEYYTTLPGFGLTIFDYVRLWKATNQILSTRMGDIIDYRAFMDNHGPKGYKSPARDWYSVVFTPKNDFRGNALVRDVWPRLKKAIEDKGLPTFEDDYLQIHVTNLRRDSSQVFVPPHRDVNRGAGLNFAIWGAQGTATTFWEDPRVTRGEITVQQSLSPEPELLIKRAELEYSAFSAYLIDATQLHGVRTVPSQNYRMVAAYAFRRNGQSVPYSEIASTLATSL